MVTGRLTYIRFGEFHLPALNEMFGPTAENAISISFKTEALFKNVVFNSTNQEEGEVDIKVKRIIVVVVLEHMFLTTLNKRAKPKYSKLYVLCGSQGGGL